MFDSFSYDRVLKAFKVKVRETVGFGEGTAIFAVIDLP